MNKHKNYIRNIFIGGMNAIIDIKSFRNIFEKQIKNKLQIKKKCNNCSKDDKMTCKMHENSTNLIKTNKNIIYHNHLPFEMCVNCPLSVK